MKNQVVEALEKIDELLKDEHCQCSNADELLLQLSCLIEDAIKWSKVFGIIQNTAKRIPYDILLEINEAAQYHGIDEIECEYDVPGFNDWYKKTYGNTVEETSGQATPVKGGV